LRLEFLRPDFSCLDFSRPDFSCPDFSCLGRTTTKVHLFLHENGVSEKINAFCTLNLEKSVGFQPWGSKINVKLSLFRPNRLENEKINALLSLLQTEERSGEGAAGRR